MEALQMELAKLEAERQRLTRDGVSLFPGEPNINTREIQDILLKIDKVRLKMQSSNPSHLLGMPKSSERPKWLAPVPIVSFTFY